MAEVATAPVPARRGLKFWAVMAGWIILAIVLIASFLGADDAAGPADRGRLTAQLDPAAQDRRETACLVRWRQYRADGLVRAGGTVPRISVLAWGRMAPAEQELFVETAACIGASGQTGPREVVLVDYLGGREVHRARAANDLAFAE